VSTKVAQESFYSDRCATRPEGTCSAFFFLSDNFFDARHGLEVHEREREREREFTCVFPAQNVHLWDSLFF
jgi:hypothetical protein